MDLWSVSLNKRWLFVMKTVNCQFTSVLLRGKKQRPLELVLRGLLQKIGRFETSPRIGRIWRIGCLKEHQTSYSPNSSYSWRRPIFCNRPLNAENWVSRGRRTDLLRRGKEWVSVMSAWPSGSYFRHPLHSVWNLAVPPSAPWLALPCVLSRLRNVGARSGNFPVLKMDWLH